MTTLLLIAGGITAFTIFAARHPVRAFGAFLCGLGFLVIAFDLVMTWLVFELQRTPAFANTTPEYHKLWWWFLAGIVLICTGTGIASKTQKTEE
jgi:hypothetical protein